MHDKVDRIAETDMWVRVVSGTPKVWSISYAVAPAPAGVEGRGVAPPVAGVLAPLGP